MPDQERVSKLRDGLAGFDPGKLGQGFSKFGEGLSNLVIGPGVVETNQSTPLNPGFRFTREGAKIRSGESFTVSSDMDSVYVDNGSKRINPLVGPDDKASTVTDPKTTFVAALPTNSLLFFNPEVVKILKELGSLV